MSSHAIIIVPPFLKTTASPLLGPAMLAGAAAAAGHKATIVDLAADWIHERLADRPLERSYAIGDHDRPDEALRDLQAEFAKVIAATLPPPPDAAVGIDERLALTYGFEEVERATDLLELTSLATWVEGKLEAVSEPTVICVSIMWSGQVLLGLLASRLARRIWPGKRIVWGGAHVTALREEIVQDARYGREVDAFVFGYAETTFVELLAVTAAGGPRAPECVRAGSGEIHFAKENAAVRAEFQKLDRYGSRGKDGTRRLTLPAQVSRGCPGQCTYCSYPKVEGPYRPLSFDGLEELVVKAQELGAAISFKDSLIVPERLLELARRIRGRVEWSACTRLNVRLVEPAFLATLAAGGCSTLEVGAETFDPDIQARIRKRQPFALFHDFITSATAAGIFVVVNYIVGFPGEDVAVRDTWLARVRQILADPTTSKLHISQFQLERLTDIAAGVGFSIEITKAWPWATVMSWSLTRHAYAGRRLVVL